MIELTDSQKARLCPYCQAAHRMASGVETTNFKYYAEREKERQERGWPKEDNAFGANWNVEAKKMEETPFLYVWCEQSKVWVCFGCLDIREELPESAKVASLEPKREKQKVVW